MTLTGDGHTGDQSITDHLFDSSGVGPGEASKLIDREELRSTCRGWRPNWRLYVLGRLRLRLLGEEIHPGICVEVFLYLPQGHIG